MSDKSIEDIDREGIRLIKAMGFSHSMCDGDHVVSGHGFFSRHTSLICIAQRLEDYIISKTHIFQDRVSDWMQECFGSEISADKVERNHRFLEEALELVQAVGCTESEALQLVRYVYSRPKGEMEQEIGGVMVTLAALCLANDVNMHECGETELNRVWDKIEKIRAKQAAKPKHSPLPEHVPSNSVVKPLVWEVFCGGDDHEYHEAETIIGYYKIYSLRTKTGGFILYHPNICGISYDTIEEAKSAAETHWRELIGKCLV